MAVINLAAAPFLALWTPMPIDQPPPGRGSWLPSRTVPFRWPGTPDIPPLARMTRHDSGVGLHRRTLRVDNQWYDDLGNLRYWYDGDWHHAYEMPEFTAHTFLIEWTEAGYPFPVLQGGLITRLPYARAGDILHFEQHASETQPMKSLTFGTSGVRVIPLRIMPSNLLVNALCQFVALSVLVGLLGAIRSAVRAWRGRCRSCGHPLQAGPVCTECGRGVPARAGDEPRARPNHTSG